MRYRIENYIAMKLHNNLEELAEVEDGFGVVDDMDVEYSNGFLVWNSAEKKVEYKYFNPVLFEKWNGTEIVIDLEKKAEFLHYENERNKEYKFKLEARERVEVLEIENHLSQEVLNFLLFKTDLDLIMSTFQSSRTKEVSSLPAYLALQISKKANKSKEEAEEFYQMSIERFPQYQEEIEGLLKL